MEEAPQRGEQEQIHHKIDNYIAWTDMCTPYTPNEWSAYRSVAKYWSTVSFVGEITQILQRNFRFIPHK
jgi:hypothetical protein